MKNFLKTVLVLIVVLIAAALFMTSRINTDSNKQAIASAFQGASGYDLIIGGDLSLDLFPSLGLAMEDVRLRNPAVPMELASTSRAVLQVPLASLLRGEIAIEEIVIDDFHVNYFVNAEGESIWELEATAQQNNPADNTAASSPAGQNDSANLSVQRISIANASIDIQDQSRGSRYRIDQLNLESQNTNINGDPFSIAVSFDYENNGMSAAVPVNLSTDIVADLGNGQIELQNIQFSVTPMLIAGQINLNDLNNEPSYTGSLSAQSFDLVGLLQSLSMVEMDSDPLSSVGTDRLLAFDLEFNGDSSRAAIPALNLDVAGAVVEVDAEVRMATDFAPMSISYNVNAGSLDLSPLPACPGPGPSSIGTGIS